MAYEIHGNVLTHADAIADLKEVRNEITRVNQASGQTVFDPAATDMLDEVLEWLKEVGQ